MKHEKLVDKWDYVLIGGGILLLPLIVGLIPIGISIYRMGHKWDQNENGIETKQEYISPNLIEELR